ncbi:hypothetical protein COLO4_33146 [Corchorus olitorius]|uniref:Neprosin PEP catalytic domain-containing protein n=1 Tax=Corchorus olitorius TaxID=93759 RepID=A0A1R3GW87_9ROSI|nr:hypothetical protein COLO4_33146 [Corchorus olitorius]
MAKKMKALGLNYPTSSQTKLEEGFAFALAKYTKHNFGAETTINVWHPSVSPNQLSLASLWIANGPVETLNILQAGWEVQPILYSSNYTRLFTFWTADGDNETGCYDYLCPGFVQVSQEVSLGLVLKDISTYNGTQKEIHIGLIKEDSDDWWLKFNNIFVGYWPKSLFNYMYGGANFVAWGGEVCSQDKEPSPAMGSGHLPQDGHYGISAYFKQTQIWDNQQLVNPDAKSVEAYSDKPKCYGAQTNQEAHGIEDWKTLSEEENLEMERQLQVINKPPIKSFRTEHGDILDCIDIYKQHAFDHPLLKDHKVKMRPKRIQKKMMKGKSSMETDQSAPFLPKNIRCPPGSVLIKRTTKEDLIMAKKMKALGLKHPTSSRFRSTSIEPKDFAFTGAEYTKHNYGAKATINVWNPSVSPNQYSVASLWIANGPHETLNVLMAGWAVQPHSYSSNYTRLFTYWTADGYQKTGCRDYLCPGFVQVSHEVSLGLVLKDISTYNGTQKEIQIGLIKDGSEWWLAFYNKFVGYWPKKLFTYMFGGANFIVWGGQVYSPANESSPPMGSGHLPQDGHDGISAYFKQMQIWNDIDFVYLDAKFVHLHSGRPKCYDAQIDHEIAAPYPVDLFYGGPGKC